MGVLNLKNVLTKVIKAFGLVMTFVLLNWQEERMVKIIIPRLFKCIRQILGVEYDWMNSEKDCKRSAAYLRSF